MTSEVKQQDTTTQAVTPSAGPPALANGQPRTLNFSDRPEFPSPITVKAMANYRAEMWQRPAEPTCPECGGAGYVRAGDFAVGQPGFGKIEHCQVCNLDRRAKWLSDNCGLNEAERERRLDWWKSGDWQGEELEIAEIKKGQRRQARLMLHQAISNRFGFYTFFGDFGSGKSMALQIVANEARLKLVESLYSPFALLLDHLRSLYGQGEQSSTFWQRLLDVPVLCIDEVTRFNETPWAREKLYILADTRYRRRSSHLTLFATNDDPRQVLPVTEDVGYLFSRMRDGQLIELRGDMRGAR